ncbi:MAG: hypothetical protein JW922_03360 [Paludibacteraceae bacterium]|nr:hypothetical protein [Paludibacteraceae bacterium]
MKKLLLIAFVLGLVVLAFATGAFVVSQYGHQIVALIGGEQPNLGIEPASVRFEPLKGNHTYGLKANPQLVEGSGPADETVTVEVVGEESEPANETPTEEYLRRAAEALERIANQQTMGNGLSSVADVDNTVPSISRMPWGTAFVPTGEVYTLPVVFEVGDYPVNGTEAEEVAYVSEMVGCKVAKVAGEPAAFYVNYKESGTPQNCKNPSNFIVTNYLAERPGEGIQLPVDQGYVGLFVGDDSDPLTWASTYRFAPWYEDPCEILEGESRFAIEEDYDLWPSDEFKTLCPAFDIDDLDLDRAEETAAMKDLFGLDLIRIGTVDAFQVQQLGDGLFEVPAFEKYTYELHFGDGTSAFASGDGTTYKDVNHVVIYPGMYFTPCEAYEIAGVAANETFDPTACGQ